MCGIFFSLSHEQFVLPDQKMLDLLKKRGPDSLKIVHRHLQPKTTALHSNSVNRSLYLTFVSTVLSLRGDVTIEQPLEDLETGSLLCWNGELWKLDGEDIRGNDTQAMFRSLVNAIRLVDAVSEARESSLRRVLKVLECSSGPFAFIFYDALFQRLFYARDALGRRSLLRTNALDSGLIVSSVWDGCSSSDWTEIDADGVYVLDLAIHLRTVNEKAHLYAPPILLVPRRRREDKSNPPIFLNSSFPSINKETPANPPALDCDSPAVNDLAQRILCSLALRVKNVPCWSATGGNSTCVAILFSGGLDCTVLARVLHDVLPFGQDIDLLNVAFENPRVLAASRIVSTDDTTRAASGYNLCPDRITGLSSYKELLRVCPERSWRFVSINVPYRETVAHRSQVVSLIFPHNTEMDLSIAYALYFAARGRGFVEDPITKSHMAYETPARVLISGLGADELFAGYTRHATAFVRKSYHGLIDELELDFNRLGKRNLGRDDRVISHWAKEARYPYLDEDLVSWALERPVDQKCGYGQTELNEDPGPEQEALRLEPSKLVLRLLAWKLDLKRAARERKRAIQFGARTAKMEAGKTKGTKVLSQLLEGVDGLQDAGDDDRTAS